MMLSGMMFKQRDIILIPIPFTDLASQKNRPAIVLTSDDLEDGNLKTTSMIRVDKIYTLNKSIVLKKFGRVRSSILASIKTSILKLIEQENASALS